MGNIIPQQTRTIDPYSSYNSNVVNQLTRIASRGVDCISGTHSIDVSVDSTSTTGLIISEGICYKDDVIIEVTDQMSVDMHDVDFYISSDHFDETGYYYILLKYSYVKSKPAPEAEITILRPSERGSFTSGYLFLKAVYVTGTPGNLVIDSVWDYDPTNPTIQREYAQFYVGTENTLPTFVQETDEGRIIYVRNEDQIYFGGSTGWISWDAIKDRIDTTGCPVGSLVYLTSGSAAGLAISTARETFAVGVVLEEGLVSTGNGVVRLFGRCDNVPVETGRTLVTGQRVYLSNIEAGSATPVMPGIYTQFVGICLTYDAGDQTCSMWFMPGSSEGSISGGLSELDEYTDTLSQSIFNKLTVDEINNDDYIDTAITTATIDFINKCITGSNGKVFQTKNLSETGYATLIPSCQIMSNINTPGNVAWFVSNGASSGEFESTQLNQVHKFSTLKIPITGLSGTFTPGSTITASLSGNTAVVCLTNANYMFVRDVVGDGTFVLNDVLTAGAASATVNGPQVSRATASFCNLYIYASFSGAATFDDYAIIYENDTNIIGFDLSSTDSGVGTFIDLDASPSVLGHKIWKPNSSALNIIDFTDAYDGKEIKIIFDSSNIVIKNGLTIKLAGGADFNGTANDTLSLVYDRATNTWYETGRSVN